VSPDHQRPVPRQSIGEASSIRDTIPTTSGDEMGQAGVGFEQDAVSETAGFEAELGLLVDRRPHLQPFVEAAHRAE
jgi:hypothetical protein